MENYDLKEDEVVLFKGNVAFNNNNQQVRLILTNENVVFISPINSEKQDETVKTEIFPVDGVKVYQGVPQVKVNSTNVEIYFKTGEKEFVFQSKNDMHQFIGQINKLITGKSGAERNAEKVKSAITLVNDTLGVDIVKSTGEVAKNGIAGSVTAIFGKIGKAGKKLFGKKTK